MREALLRGIALLLVIGGCRALSFTTQRRIGVAHLSRSRIQADSLAMRDASSAYWFNAGDSVRVVEDVSKAGTTLRGRVGTVIQTWEKCDVDPTCCCAEQVDLGMAVRVEFKGTETDSSVNGSFIHYFAEEELTIVKEDDATETDAAVPFDGMSCKAFKLQHLQMGQQAKRIAAFEQSRTDDS